MSRRRSPNCGTAPAAARRKLSMAKRMLIDATHPEETRVAVVDGRRLEEFDVEVASRKQLKGNIYLAKITRVEPSLQAAFVEYGGNRHGFLAFGDIHPDYYQIPYEDRRALLAERAAEEQARARAEDEGADADAERAPRESAETSEPEPIETIAASSPAEVASEIGLDPVMPMPEEAPQPAPAMPERGDEGVEGHAPADQPE